MVVPMSEKWHEEFCSLLKKVATFFKVSFLGREGDTVSLPEGRGILDVTYLGGVKTKIDELRDLGEAIDSICKSSPIAIEVEDLRSWSSYQNLISHLKKDIKKMMHANPMGIILITNEKMPEKLKLTILKELKAEDAKLFEIYKEKIHFLHLNDHKLRKIKNQLQTITEKRNKLEELTNLIFAFAFILSSHYVRKLLEDGEVTVPDKRSRSDLREFFNIIGLKLEETLFHVVKLRNNENLIKSWANLLPCIKKNKESKFVDFHNALHYIIQHQTMLANIKETYNIEEFKDEFMATNDDIFKLLNSGLVKLSEVNNTYLISIKRPLADIFSKNK